MCQQTMSKSLAARWLLSGFIVASLTFAIACGGEKARTPASAGSPALTHEQKIANAHREDNNGWIYLHLEGAPEVVGYQHGYLAVAEIVDVRDALVMSLEHDTKKNWEFYPGRTVQAKAVDGTLAAGLKFWASMGHPCGQTFVAKDFLKAHPEYAWQEKFLKDLPGQPWTLFGKRRGPS